MSVPDKKGEEPKFQTHIPEPRWQQVASVIIVVIGIIIWLLIITHR